MCITCVLQDLPGLCELSKLRVMCNHGVFFSKLVAILHPSASCYINFHILLGFGVQSLSRHFKIHRHRPFQTFPTPPGAMRFSGLHSEQFGNHHAMQVHDLYDSPSISRLKCSHDDFAHLCCQSAPDTPWRQKMPSFSELSAKSGGWIGNGHRVEPGRW